LWFEASLGKYLARTYLEKTLHKKGLVEWLKVVAPEFKPQYCKKEKMVNRDVKEVGYKHSGKHREEVPGSCRI
jgi:hypothetical protein